MLETHARQLFDIIGKEAGAQGRHHGGADAGGHRRARGRARSREGHNAHNNDDYAVEGHDEAAEKQHVSLHQRATPLLHMLKDSLADGKNVIWEPHAPRVVTAEAVAPGAASQRDRRGVARRLAGRPV